MNQSDARRQGVGPGLARSLAEPRRAELVAFLTERLREDLAEIWRRGEPPGPGRPGMAAQIDVVDDLLRMLDAGRLPQRAELRMLLFGYGQHPEFETRWNEHLRD